MQILANVLGWILAKIGAAVKWIGDLAVAVFESLWDIGRDFVCWVFDSVLSIAVTVLSAFDFSALVSAAGAWAGLPAMLLEVLAAIGLSTAVGLIVTAIGIRLMLQLVPFTRLGS